MKKKIEKVPTEDITAEEVLALWREGKLYHEKEEENLSESDQLALCQNEVLEYVSAINEYVVAELRPYIKEIWEAILTDEMFVPVLLMRKGRMCGHLNRYVVTNIVFHLRALDIYQCDNLLELHKKLEGVNQKNGIYKAASLYSLSKEQRKRLRELKSVIAGQK